MADHTYRYNFKTWLDEMRRRHPDWRLFSGKGYCMWAPKNSCFFCQHLKDIFYDYSNGPYLFICAEAPEDHDPTDEGLKGNCKMFVEKSNGKRKDGEQHE